jgi:hypothetical protein
MGAKSLVSSVRSLLVAGLLSASACATLSRRPEPAPWVPGSYSFQTVLHGETILGQIDVEADGPIEVETSLSRCMPQASVKWQPWYRSRVFHCAGNHRLVVTVGTEKGVPVAGSMSNTTAVSKQEVVSKVCVEYAEPSEQGGRVCLQWDEKIEWVTRDVTELSRILIVASAESVTP